MSALFDLKPKVPDFSIERAMAVNGQGLIAGIDEAGRGSLAGPLCVGLVIYDSSCFENSEFLKETPINDSKKMNHKRRLEAKQFIEEKSLLSISQFISHRIIDETNINVATETAISKILNKLPIKPDALIIDGNFKFQLDVPSFPVVKGDQKSLTIASASVIAKVNRDLLMEDLDKRFPDYGFAANKGYGTKNHLERIKHSGPSEIHRLTYEPVKGMVAER